MSAILRLVLYFLTAVVLQGSLFPGTAFGAIIDDTADLPSQQAQEKLELEEMKGEMNDIKSTMGQAARSAEQLQARLSGGQIQEIYLLVKESTIELTPGVTSSALTYNAQVPGPVLRLKEGAAARIVLHNQTKQPTSLCLHGLLLPQSVAGLPRQGAGLVNPGETFVFQFVAPRAGTYWYHPQVPQSDQTARGLFGAIVVEPAGARTYERDFVLVLAQSTVSPKAGTTAGAPRGSSTYFTINGKSAPSIAPLELASGERVRLRIINAGQQSCPLFLSGHHFEVVATNGSDALEPHASRDTLCVQPGDRYDLEFVADNPGVWSLASIIPAQTNNDGKFPGGMAMVVRYKH